MREQELARQARREVVDGAGRRPRVSLLTTDSVPAVGGVADYLHGMMCASVADIEWRLWSLVGSQAHLDAALPYATVRLGLAPRRLGERTGDRIPPWRRLNTCLWRLRRGREARALLRRVVREDSPDVVVVGRWCEDAHNWCVSCRALGVPYVIMTYGLELVEAASTRGEAACVQDLSLAALVFGCSSHTVRLVDTLTANRAATRVLFPGVSCERLRPVAEPLCSELLDELGVGNGQFVLAMGRLVHRKGFDLAVRAFGRIAGEFPDTSLVVAGDGEARSEVEAARRACGCLERVRMLGQVTDEQKRALLQECLFYMMPNVPTAGDMEGFGIVFLEANLFGKAVIGGNNGGVPDAVLHEQTGLLVDTPDLDALATAMGRLAGSQSLRDRLGEQGRQRALGAFGWSALSRPFVREVAGLRLSPVRSRAGGEDRGSQQ